MDIVELIIMVLALTLCISAVLNWPAFKVSNRVWWWIVMTILVAAIVITSGHLMYLLYVKMTGVI